MVRGKGSDAIAKGMRQTGTVWFILACFAEDQIFSMNDPWMFGWTLTIVGMGGTLLSLWVLSVLVSVLKKIFPHKPEHAP